MRKRDKDMTKLDVPLRLLITRKPMLTKYRDHQLSDNLTDFRECHIEGDWILIYRIFEGKLILSASGTGSHSDLFDE